MLDYGGIWFTDKRDNGVGGVNIGKQQTFFLQPNLTEPSGHQQHGWMEDVVAGQPDPWGGGHEKFSGTVSASPYLSLYPSNLQTWALHSIWFGGHRHPINVWHHVLLESVNKKIKKILLLGG